MSMSFLLKDAASPVIYTYLHSLTLHDSLPIWPSMSDLRKLYSGGGGSTSVAGFYISSFEGSRAFMPADLSGDGPSAQTIMFHEYAHRSEEHTSELQSLMRISYAVFC